MGDLADDVFSHMDIQEQDEWLVEKEYRFLSDIELKSSIENLINDDLYQDDKYTQTVKDIIKYDKFSEKQREFLIKHAIYHHYDYDNDVNIDGDLHDDWGNRN